MIPSAFEYARATSLDEALALLVKHGEGSKILAGGHSLVPMMKLRLAEPSVLIDIGGIAALSGIAFDGKRFVIGATTKHAAMAARY
jgi:carbon-monoxide dehydrogenase medium subunit